ncbi:MAG: hypothetical protein JSW51_09250 [Gemmatimonadota bacterium]|nr:MAG: hypothetical protein JSW51_09250 [Gemmatimonadota bacterium]
MAKTLMKGGNDSPPSTRDAQAPYPEGPDDPRTEGLNISNRELRKERKKSQRDGTSYYLRKDAEDLKAEALRRRSAKAKAKAKAKNRAGKFLKPMPTDEPKHGAKLLGR